MAVLANPVPNTNDSQWDLQFKQAASHARDDGQYGTITETGTTAHTGINCFAIQILADAVFSVLTETGADATSDAMTGFTITAGTVIYGQFTAFTLTSGKVRAYKTKVS